MGCTIEGNYRLVGGIRKGVNLEEYFIENYRECEGSQGGSLEGIDLRTFPLLHLLQLDVVFLW